MSNMGIVFFFVDRLNTLMVAHVAHVDRLFFFWSYTFSKKKNTQPRVPKMQRYTIFQKKLYYGLHHSIVYPPGDIEDIL